MQSKSHARRLRDPQANDIPDDFVALWKDALKTNAKAGPRIQKKCDHIVFQVLKMYTPVSKSLFVLKKVCVVSFYAGC